MELTMEAMPEVMKWAYLGVSSGSYRTDLRGSETGFSRARSEFR
jgi:hypothetical protein